MSARRVMLITGTRSGIGKALAQHYAESGYHVIGCSRGPADFEQENYEHFLLDVANEEKVRDLFFAISSTHGRLDILINNAADLTINYAVLTPPRLVRSLVNTNFIGPYLFSCEAVKLMQRHNFGRIVNFSSIAVPLAEAGCSAYGATKAALETFSKILAKEVVANGITVNVLSLSLVKNSGMIAKIHDKSIKATLDKTITKSVLNVDDIIHAINLFISPQSFMVTGQIIYLGGV